jgi:hypothetical protein
LASAIARRLDIRGNALASAIAVRLGDGLPQNLEVDPGKSRGSRKSRGSK